MPERQQLAEMVTEARHAGARLATACAEVGLSARTYQRWHEGGAICADGRPEADRPTPPQALTEAERATLLTTCHERRFADLPPSQIVPRLADEGVYLASESSFYRVLRAANEQHRRGRAHAPSTSEPTRQAAARPNAVWCWDITYLPSRVVGLFFYLYAVIDLWSRKLVAWEVHAAERGDLAATLIEKAVWREHLRPPPEGSLLVLHSDNGAPMTAFTLKAKLEALGIRPSHSRPGVSDDNAHIEAWFRTGKYRPDYPVHGFASLEEARTWVHGLVDWYNDLHRHSAIGFVTPSERHAGHGDTILAQRRAVYEAAKARHPHRWSRHTRRWDAPATVWLNPPPKAEAAPWPHTA